jgi:hypothetical protein
MLAENAQLKEQMSYNVPFNGDSKALLTAVYRGEYMATPQQIYAARAVLDREHPLVDRRSGKGIREEVRQEFVSGSRDDTIEKLMDQIRRMRKAERQHTTLDQRVRRFLELDLVEIVTDEEPSGDDKEAIKEALSDLDGTKLDRLADVVNELWPEHCALRCRFGELIPPSPPALAVRSMGTAAKSQ